MKRIAVFGCGLVGGLIVRDAASEPATEVLAVDAADAALARLEGVPHVRTQRADLSDPAAVRRWAAEADAVALAVPGFMGTRALRAVIAARRPVADISFSPENPLELRAEAEAAGVAAIVDIGVAPGISNLLVGRAVAELDETDSVLVLVGGLPVRRVWPHEYRLVFSLTDVLEEYTRPCRYRENGAIVIREALSDAELVDIPRVGTLEAFNTDGLRTLLDTIPARTLKEKTMRFPGHAERMRILRDTGLFDRAPVRADGVEVSPRAVTEALLARAWALPPGDEEFTVLRVDVLGRRGGRRHRILYDLYDRTDPATGATSMARTTGFPCSIVTRLLADGAWTRAGVHPPEVLGRDEAIAGRILAGLEARGVRIDRSDTDLGEP